MPADGVVVGAPGVVDAPPAGGAWWAALAAHLPDAALYVLDADHCVVEVAGSALAASGLDVTAMVGRRLAEVLHPDDARRIGEAVDAALAGRSIAFDMIAATSGNDLHIDVVPVAGRAEVVALARNRSAERRQARAHAVAASRWQAAYSDAPTAMCELDLDGLVVGVNRAFEQLTGRRGDELIGGPVQAILHPDDVAPSRRGVETLRDPHVDRLDQVERRVLRPDGTIRWTAGRATKVVPDGAEPFVVVHLVDITAEKAHRDTVAEAGARLSALLETSADLIAVLDADLVLRYASPAYQRIFGRPADDALDTPSPSRVHPDDRDTFATTLAGIGAGGSATYSIRVLRPDGQVRWIEATATNRLADPLVGGYVVTARDATDAVEQLGTLVHAATHDPLTGLRNRKGLEQRLAEPMTGPRAVVAIDLDGFKAVNDAHGHGAGDEVLVVVARRLRASVRPDDTVARIGGDEFVVVTDRADHAPALAARLEVALRRPISLTDGSTVTVGAAAGIGTYGPGDDPVTALAAADGRLYAAKRGR